MARADFAFHVFAERNDIAVRHDAYFVGLGDAVGFIFGGVAGFGALLPRQGGGRQPPARIARRGCR